MEREVALKLPHPSRLQTQKDKARILREAKAAAQLRHPNIVPVYDAGNDGDQFFIASAFIEGQTLAESLEQEQPDFRRASQLVADLAAALEYSHQLGIVHRDVKPGNIMLDAKGNSLLTDFGLARFVESDDQLTHDGTVLGTPAYMAPEQARGEHDGVGPASDQYSLGVVLYQLLCGRRPFSGPPAAVIADVINKEPTSPRTINPRIPKDLETICLKAMSKHPGQRYAGCGELAEDLRRWMQGEPIRSRRMGSLERMGRWSRRNPVLAATALLVLILGCVSTLFAVGLFQSRQELARALEDANQQADLARQQTAKAEEHRARAEKQSRIANEERKKAADALAQLQAAVAKKELADELRKVAEKTTSQLGKTVKEQKSQIGAGEAALDATKKKLNQKAREAEDALKVNSWLAYTENLAAADKAYIEDNFILMAEKLRRCPKEHRAWEWHYLNARCNGLRPVEKVTPTNGRIIDLSSSARWLLADWPLPKENVSHLAVYELPNTTPKYAHQFSTGARITAEGLSPNGRFLLFGGRNVFDFVEEKRHTVSSQAAYRPFAFTFSADGAFALLRDDRGWNRLIAMQNGRPLAFPDPSLPMSSKFSGFSTFTASGELAGAIQSASGVPNLHL